MKKTVINDCLDGDWKTASIKGSRTIKAGEEVEILDEFTNFYGKYAFVKTSDGMTANIEQYNLS